MATDSPALPSALLPRLKASFLLCEACFSGLGALGCFTDVLRITSLQNSNPVLPSCFPHPSNSFPASPDSTTTYLTLCFLNSVSHHKHFPHSILVVPSNQDFPFRGWKDGPVIRVLALADAGVQFPEPTANSSQPTVTLALRSSNGPLASTGTCTHVHKFMH